MQKLTRAVVIVALGIFAGIVAVEVLFNGSPLNADVIWTGIFGALIGAMVYAALSVAGLIFKKDDKQ